MNKQKKTKLMAALSLLLTCAPCNFANASEENSSYNSIEMLEDKKEDKKEDNEEEKVPSAKEKNNNSPSHPKEIYTDKDLPGSYNIHEITENEENKEVVETLNEKLLSYGHHIEKYKHSDNTDKEYITLPYGPVNIMNEQDRKRQLILRVGVPAGFAVLGVLGFGVYKGIKKMKKDGKPQPKQNVENKGKKLVSPNVKNN